MKKNLLKVAISASALLITDSAMAQVVQTFTFTGASQSFTVPNCVNTITISARGASGGGGNVGGPGANLGGIGGSGANATGVITVTPGQVLNLFIGGQGTVNVGGFNGGGAGNNNSGGGGGATDVRFGGTALANRILVAGGGGGGRGGCESTVPAVIGGAGGNGGSNGTNGVNATTSGGFAGGGAGGTGTLGGVAGIGCGGFLGTAGGNGSLAIGGNGGGGQNCCCFSNPSIPAGGGGGGGYFGGGAGGGGSAGTTGCSGNDKGAGGGGAGGTNYFDVAFTSTAISTSTASGNGQIIISYNTFPTVTLTSSSASVCANSNVTITASGASTYTWNNGSTANSVVFNPSVTTVYTATGSLGCWINTRTISIFALPLPTISVNSGTICNGNSFTLVPTGALSYTYPATVSPTVTTSYTVIGVGSNGCLSNIATSNVTVIANPTISASSATICSGGTATLTASGANTYTWNTGSNASSITVSPASTTNYTVGGANLAGCRSNTLSLSVTIGAAPSVVVNSSTVCSGNSATLTASGLTTYTWNTGANTNSIIVSPTVTTTYSVNGNLLGCATQASNSSTVIVNSTIVTANVTSTIICSGQSGTLTANGASTYSWSNGSNGSSIVVSPTVSTNYTVTGTGPNGCIGNAVVTQSVELCTGISNKSGVFSTFNVNPNPANDFIVVSSIKSLNNQKMEIINSVGQLVKVVRIESEKQTVLISDLAKGVYFVKLNGATSKFVKE